MVHELQLVVGTIIYFMITDKQYIPTGYYINTSRSRFYNVQILEILRNKQCLISVVPYDLSFLKANGLKNKQ